MSYEINPWRFAALWLWFCLPVIHAGCGGGRLDVPEPGTYAPLAAVSLGVAATSDAPAPSPTPTPSGKCENCNGTGRLGDGTVSVPCPVCGGDGRTDNEPPAVPQVDEPKPDPPAIKPHPGPLTLDPAKVNQQTPVTDEQRAVIRQEYDEPAPRRGLFRRRGSTGGNRTLAGSC